MIDVDVFPSDTSWLSEPTTGVHQFGGGSSASLSSDIRWHSLQFQQMGPFVQVKPMCAIQGAVAAQSPRLQSGTRLLCEKLRCPHYSRSQAIPSGLNPPFSISR